MTEPQLTICCVTRNTLNGVALMRESFLKYHPNLPVLFYGWDNGSTDGAKEYMMQNFHHVHECEVDRCWGGIADGADALCKLAETDYIALVDSDVEFLSDGILATLIDSMQLNHWDCICLYPPVSEGIIDLPDYYGDMVRCTVMPRIDTAFAVWRKDSLHSLLQYSTWGRFQSIDKRWFGDGGALLYRDAIIRGLHIERPAWLSEHIKHYGQVGMMYADPERTWFGHDGSDITIQKQAALERYAEIGRRLTELRKHE